MDRLVAWQRWQAFSPVRPLLLVLVLALSSALPAGSAALRPDEIPTPLRPWTDWVLHGHESELCPFLNGAKGSEALGCVWPAILQLELDGSGGRFTQRWKLYTASLVPLPGDEKRWPHEVSVDGRPAPVALHNGQPSVQLAPGTHVISGKFRWHAMPELLAIPPQTGIVRLALRGRPVPSPNRDAANRLWLEPRTNSPGDSADRLEVVIQRRVIDEIPLRLDTRVVLSVAGASREAVLGRPLPDGFIPMSLSGPLPARLDPDGRLRVQLRPGNWTLNLHARHDGPSESLGLPTQDDGAVWTSEEIWVFEARPHLRLVDVTGPPIIDPSQTTIPAAWKRLPTYLMGTGARLKLIERRRGDQDPASDDLRLSRTLWLDFDGSGYTVSDRIEGSIRRSTRLEAKTDFELGRVTIEGADQLITQLEGSEHAGVEVPLGPISLTAEGRLPDRESLSAVSWGHDFQGLSGELWLPPGWRIFHATGVDSASTTWLNHWTLLDLFVVLVAAIASFRLWGFVWGALALMALVLTYTEPHAPRWIWIGVLVGEALRRALPEGRFAAGVRLLRWVVLAGLLYVTLPFAVGQIRIAMHPALELAPSLARGAFAPGQLAASESPALHEREAAEALGYLEDKPESKIRKLAPRSSVAYDGLVQKFDRYAQDPQAHITTGPGIPSWTWRRVELQWSGPVDRDQPLHFILLPPMVVSILGFLRVALLGALVLRFLDVAPGGQSSPLAPWLRRRAPKIAMGIALLLSVTPTTRAADFPSEAVLSQLRDGLLEKPSCYPDCATLSKLLIDVSDSTLTLRLTVDSAAPTAIPLPGGAKSFRPARVSVNGEPATGMQRDAQGTLWLAVSQGRHEIIARGWLPDRNNFDLPFPLQPHYVTATAPGWEVNGLHEDGLAEATLQITRTEQTDSPKLDPGELPPLLEVQRTLTLGLDWTLDTQVRRLTPSDTAVVVEIPLLPGESVTSGHIRVREGRALVSLQPGAVQAAWQSELEESSPLQLAAAQALPITEVWRLDVSPIWHVEASGIPPVHSATNVGARIREWRPWPGEKVDLDIQRPAGVGGATVTIDSSHLTVNPGLRSTDATLRLQIRSSRGGQHTIGLPKEAELQTVSVDGETQPIRQERRNVILPLQPGKRTIELVWREPHGLSDGFLYSTPEVSLGIASVNAEVQLRSSAGRWILGLGGPQLGPAVLFWPLLFALLVVSVCLGRLRLSPLRTHHWLLLLIGLTQIPIAGAAIVVAWLLMLGWRREQGDTLSNASFDFVQLLLVGLTCAALFAMYFSIHKGLLGSPQMQISGNGSNAAVLNWYQARATVGPPIAWAFSVPVMVYRIAMLAWALWLAQALLRWLRWGWECFGTGALWRPLRNPPRQHEQASIPVEPPD